MKAMITSVNGPAPKSQIRDMYGDHALVTRVGKINIVHLDRPSQETINKRIDEVIREEMTGEAWDKDCPCCQAFKDLPHDVVYFGDL